MSAAALLYGFIDETRGYDAVRLRIGVHVAGNDIRYQAVLIQQTTGRPEQFALTDDVRAKLVTLLRLHEGAADDFEFPSWSASGFLCTSVSVPTLLRLVAQTR